MKKSTIILLFAALLTSASVFAQSIQDGINNLYAERNQSAKAIFEKMVSSNPNNMEATYWLGQTDLAMGDTAGAQSVYQKALAANGNAPLVLVGMGHLELLQGKTDEAKQKFESAITMSHGRKGNDPNVLNAIGRANVDAKAGDTTYAISKLTEAAQLAPNNPDILLNLGNAYRKAHEGGKAVTAYIKATQLNPNFAPAYYRMARIYETQRNWDIYTQDLQKAIQVDPKFAPAYYGLYYYTLTYPRDFSKAETYANQYIANSDPSVQNDYIKAQTAFVQKHYDTAISTAKNIIEKAGEQTNPRVYRLLGYSYLEKGDTVSARPYVDQLFAKAKEEDIVPMDYILQADAYASTNPDMVVASYLKAAKQDTVVSNQMKFLQEGIDRFKASGQKELEGDLRLAQYKLQSNPNPAELFQIGLPFYQGRNFQRADSVFTAYSTALPDSIYGYYWSALSKSQQDSTMSQGLAVPDFQKVLDIASKDTARFKSQGVQASGYLAGYYNNVKNDKATAIQYLQKGLTFDPQNESIKSSLDVLQKAASRPAARSSSGTKTKTKTTTKKTTTKKKG